MSGLDGDQLQALRDRVEEDYRRAVEAYRRAEQDYRLDVSAIEYLQRRFFGGVSSIPASHDAQLSIEPDHYSQPSIESGKYSQPSIATDRYSQPSVETGSYSQPSVESTPEPAATLPQEYTPARQQCDGLEDSLRSMFTSSRG